MTLSTSDKKTVLRYCLADGIAAAFFALFGAVYEIFSHEVYSYFMLYAFAVPLVLGVLPLLLYAIYGKHQPDFRGLRHYHEGIAALTVGSVFQGVLAIYGTENRLVWLYLLVGIFLCEFGISELLRGTDCKSEQSNTRTAQ